jgi:hypothetical protein
MTRYPYEGRDLFAEPETYFYAACDAPDYLDEWRESRRRAIARMQPEAGQVTDRVASCGGTPLAAILERLRDELARGADAAAIWRQVEPFARKYEVFKRLFSHYDGDRRHPDAVPARLGDYVRFADCLAAVAERGGSLQALSTLLKVGDALCSRPEGPYSAADLRLLRDVLEREQALVQRYA